MTLGMSLSAFTLLHTAISLVGIASGFVAVVGMLRGNPLNGWTTVFLVSTALTSVTGFMFPATKILPSHVFGVISILGLAVVFVALYVKHLAGAWRRVYVIGALFVLYLNTVVGVVQSFQKLAFLTPLAPTQSEPPFLIAQAAILVVFIVAGILVSKRFRPSTSSGRTVVS